MKYLARLGLLASIPACAALSACGKEDNVHEPVLLEFPHSFPEQPQPLSQNLAKAWTAGHALAVTDKHVFVADRDNREVVRLDRKTLTREAAVAIGGKPEQIVISDEGVLFVSSRSGEVLRISQDLKIEARTKLGTDVFGIALSADATTVYATLPFERELRVLDVADLGEVAEPVMLLDTPRGVSASPNGWVMVVHQFSPAVKVSVDADNIPLTTDETTLRTANPGELVENLRIGGLQAARAIATVVSPEDGSAFIAHITAAPGTEADFLNTGGGQVVADNGSSGGYGGSSSAPPAAFPIPTRPVEATVTATNPDATTRPSQPDFPVQDVLTGEPMMALVDQPVDINHHPSWSLLFVTGYGSDNVLVMSTADVAGSPDPARSPLAVIDVGHAPRGIAFSPDGNTAYVLNEHQLTVSTIDLRPFFSLEPIADGSPVTVVTNAAVPVPSGAFDAPSQSSFTGFDPSPSSPRVHPFRLKADKGVAYGVDPMPAAIRRGARVYTFARNENLSHAGEFACGTCHFEGGEDKLVWFITDGPRQTPALAGRLAGTQPFNWGGTKDALKDNMSQTVERMGGQGLPNRDLADLEQFLLFGLEAPANPNVAIDGTLTPDQLAGKAIFESKEAACSSCHRTLQDFTDGLTHDVGTASKAEVVRHEFDLAVNPNTPAPWVLNTPTLKGLFYTAPYLHDGSAKTLDEVLTRTENTMGKSSHLDDEGRRQLIAYLMTL